MAKRGIKARRLSKAAGLNDTAVRDLLNKVDDPRVGTLLRLANALEISPATLFGGMLPISGTIGQAGRITDGHSPHKMVPRPPEADGDLLAYLVDGDYLLPAYRSGDVIYCSRKHDVIKDSYFGEECVAKLVNGGGAYLRTLDKGGESDRFTLRSFNATALEDVSLEWAAPVLFVLKRNALDH